ncbi:PREDICTED: fucolectin-like, partial [Nanorana parkeri]|uniref:fucolectin-like n=1 Tax=Nanorana parkeri TaxID=125878 RepID=UPI0008545E9F
MEPLDSIAQLVVEIVQWDCNVCAANIARSGEATQSSTLMYHDISSVASNAIDGGKDQDWGHNSCSHTNGEWESWWRLDLQQKHKVNMVVVYGRSDSLLERMKGLEVRVGDSPNIHNPVCGKITNYTNPTTTFHCNGMEGRYISAVIPGRSEYLTLCEVEVY